MKIREIDHGIAHVLVDSKGKKEICMNKNLKKYPNLYNKVLKHELGHFKSTKKMDFKHDFGSLFSSEINNLEMAKFMINHPKSFSEISPFWIEKKAIIINWFLLILWLVVFYIVFLINLFILK
jgi:hypothetical protein